MRERENGDVESMHFVVDGHDLGLGRPIGMHPSFSAATLTNPAAPSRSGDLMNDHPNPPSRQNSGTAGGSSEGNGDSDDAGQFAAPKTAGEKIGKPQNLEETKKDSPPSGDDAEKGEDPNLVTWYGTEDPENP